jgi:hypothetical protein
MRRLRQELKWWGLFALMPLTVVLIVLDDEAPLSQTWRLILLGGIAVVICALALRWVERNPELVERAGADSLTNYRPLYGGDCFAQTARNDAPPCNSRKEEASQ